MRRLVLDGALAEPLADEGAVLEHLGVAAEEPRVVRARPLEGSTLRGYRVTGRPSAGFAAFLDGTQTSRVVAYVAGFPIVHATVAAVIRVRVNRRLVTWRRDPRVERFVCVPRAHAPPALWERLTASGVRLVNVTAPDAQERVPAPHPLAVMESALRHVQTERERVERRLALDWCGSEEAPLFIDGGVSGSDRVASARCAVGVVKSHRTLYAEGEAQRVVLGLPGGWRSSVFLVDTGGRASVASWYLRLRDTRGRDPLWGLVRVECARTDDVGERADEISRWILAEALPLAVPDHRWDKMVYGIRDCEEFLKAIS